MTVVVDLTGKRYNRWRVLSREENSPSGKAKWLCECACGQQGIVFSTALRSGISTSCGCRHIEIVTELKTTHGLCTTKAYKSWIDMRDRCSNPNNDQYHNYGGRGIQCCTRWNDFQKFFNDMGERPKRLTLERINNEKGYEPDNCKWATYTEQANNRRPRKSHKRGSYKPKL